MVKINEMQITGLT